MSGSQSRKQKPVFPPELLGSIKSQMEQEQEDFKEVKAVTWEPVLQGLKMGMYGFLGDKYGPSPQELEALIKMFNISYWQASLYQHDCEWAVKEYAEFKEGYYLILKEEHELETKEATEYMPLFQNWFLDKYRQAWITMMRSKLTSVTIRSPTFAERREKRLELQAMYGTVQGSSFFGGGSGVPSSLRQSMKVEDVMAAEHGGAEE